MLIDFVRIIFEIDDIVFILKNLKILKCFLCKNVKGIAAIFGNSSFGNKHDCM